MPDIYALTTRLSAKGLTLLFAAESGSRAWGFASPDSDYDVRFVFCSEPRAYLGLADVPQTIEYKDGEDDVAGWDLRKTLLLARKSNPSLIEWLRSPIIYYNHRSFILWLYTIVATYYDPRALGHHYVNFMRNIRGKYLEEWKGEYTLKRYFYALRPIFTIMHIQHAPFQFAPLDFTALCNAVCPVELRAAVYELLERKKAGLEIVTAERIEILDVFIAEWYDKGHEIVKTLPTREFPIDGLNTLFLDMIGYAKA